ncbi:hypothetical protein DMC30DRAFT_418047 [Rhodotorula diobovata]|uniref:Proteophosphoglycan ppg4 n=1 Tax=Rhodotorula diobovata TaxID=5288 RepID=A0A5C5FSI0_9BASI|nr:hypothetical protein DMC30DRAFT_418047 [Rhodotorula diobovata]
MSNPKHNYPPLKHNDDDDSDGSIVMRTGANKAATKEMERAVFAGKKAIWPLFFATLLVGVGTSVWGLLKETGDLHSVFIVVLIGWGVLVGIEGGMLHELSTVRRSHHPKIVLRICFIFGGWFTGYMAGSCVLIGVWMWQGRLDGSHKLAFGLLIVQALLCIGVVVAFVFYIMLYGRKLRTIQIQSKLKTPGTAKQISAAVGDVKRKVSQLSQRSKRSSVPSRRSSASTRVGRTSSTASKRSGASTLVPSDSSTDSDSGGGSYKKGATATKAGGKGYDDDGGSTDGASTSGSEDTLLPQSQYNTQARSKAPKPSRPASTASVSQYSSSAARTGPPPSSSARPPPSMRVGSPTFSSPDSRAPPMPVTRSSSTRVTIPVIVRNGSQTTSASFDPLTSRYVAYSTSPDTGPAPAPANAYTSRAGPTPLSTSPQYTPYRPLSTPYSAAPPPSGYRSYSYSPPTSPGPASSAPGSASSRDYTRSSSARAPPGVGIRPTPPPSSAPPPSSPRYAPSPSSYPFARSASSASSYPASTAPYASTSAASSAYGPQPASAPAPSARPRNPDALPAMPLYQRHS